MCGYSFAMSQTMEVDGRRAQNCNERVGEFLQSMYLGPANHDCIESKLVVEKNRRRNLQERIRKQKYKVKSAVEKLKALEISKDNLDINIQNYEEQLAGARPSLR